MRTRKYHHNGEKFEFYIQGLLDKNFTLRQVLYHSKDISF